MNTLERRHTRHIQRFISRKNFFEFYERIPRHRSTWSWLDDMEWVSANPTVSANLVSSDHTFQKKRTRRALWYFQICDGRSQEVSGDCCEYGDDVWTSWCFRQNPFKDGKFGLNLDLQIKIPSVEVVTFDIVDFQSTQRGLSPVCSGDSNFIWQVADLPVFGFNTVANLVG